jgi:hypothetical protein
MRQKTPTSRGKPREYTDGRLAANFTFYRFRVGKGRIRTLEGIY